MEGLVRGVALQSPSHLAQPYDLSCAYWHLSIFFQIHWQVKEHSSTVCPNCGVMTKGTRNGSFPLLGMDPWRCHSDPGTVGTQEYSHISLSWRVSETCRHLCDSLCVAAKSPFYSQGSFPSIGLIPNAKFAKSCKFFILIRRQEHETCYNMAQGTQALPSTSSAYKTSL